MISMPRGGQDHLFFLLFYRARVILLLLARKDAVVIHQAGIPTQLFFFLCTEPLLFLQQLIMLRLKPRHITGDQSLPTGMPIL